MYLIGDIGNTETKILILNDKFKTKVKYIFKTKLISKKYIETKFLFLKKKNRINRALFCSVVPKAFNIFKKFIFEHSSIRCMELKNYNFSKFVKILVDKKQIGSDRIANAIAVSHLNKNFIVVDFGTATTFDVIKKKSYLGGVIAPGIELSLINLYKKACLIPKIQLKRQKKIIGKNTISSVRSGFFWGYSGLIANIIKIIRNQTRTNYKIIFTGGLSNLFKSEFDFEVYVDKELTLKGIKKILKETN